MENERLFLEIAPVIIGKQENIFTYKGISCFKVGILLIKSAIQLVVFMITILCQLLTTLVGH